MLVFSQFTSLLGLLREELSGCGETIPFASADIYAETQKSTRPELRASIDFALVLKSGLTVCKAWGVPPAPATIGGSGADIPYTNSYSGGT